MLATSLLAPRSTQLLAVWRASSPWHLLLQHGRPSNYAGEVETCHFCSRPAPDKWALTSCSGDPEDTASWSRHILPVCARCNRLLDEGGDAGRVLKATGVRWYGGHRVGRFAAKGVGLWSVPNEPDAPQN